jgi:hypothetical protein
MVLTVLAGWVPVQANAADSERAAKRAGTWTEPSEKPPGGFASWRELFAFQARLNKVADRITAVEPGNPSIIAAPQDRALRVYWKGTIPAEVKQIARQADVPVYLSAAAYTHKELTLISKRLVEEQPHVVEASANADGSGVDVAVEPGFASLAGEAVRNAAGVPVSVDKKPKMRPMIGRQGDTVPYWGGSRFYTVLGPCTNGFALWAPGSANRLMLTAAHCGPDGAAVSIPGQPNPAGTLLGRNACRDTGVIFYNNAVDGAIYTGPWNSNAGLYIGGWQADYRGNLVFTSGASAGVRAGPVLDVDRYLAGSACASIGPMTIAGYTTNVCMIAPGDSGGPVFVDGGFSRAIGRGTIYAGIPNTAVCANTDRGTVAGSNQVAYAPLYRPPDSGQIGSLQYYGVELIYYN